jgi:hypothetical protein
MEYQISCTAHSIGLCVYVDIEPTADAYPLARSDTGHRLLLHPRSSPFGA